MTGGEKHSWHQQQQKHVFRSGTPAASFGLDPNLLSEISPIWWNNIIKAVCMGSMLNRCSSWHKGWLSPKEMEAVLCVISLYIEDFLTVIQAWRCWYVTGGLADFVSLPIIGHCVIKGHQCQGRCLGLPGLAFATCIYELPFISWSGDKGRIALSYVKTTVNTAGFFSPHREKRATHK